MPPNSGTGVTSLEASGRRAGTGDKGFLCHAPAGPFSSLACSSPLVQQTRKQSASLCPQLSWERDWQSIVTPVSEIEPGIILGSQDKTHRPRLGPGSSLSLQDCVLGAWGGDGGVGLRVSRSRTPAGPLLPRTAMPLPKQRTLCGRFSLDLPEPWDGGQQVQSSQAQREQLSCSYI